MIKEVNDMAWMQERARGRRGMHTAEYAICFGLVIAAVVGMQTYVKRALQARIKTATDAVAAATKDKTIVEIAQGQGLPPEPLTMTGLLQYEPYYEDATNTSKRANLTQETHDKTKALTTTERKEQSRQTRVAGSEQKEAGAGALDQNDDWN